MLGRSFVALFLMITGSCLGKRGDQPQTLPLAASAKDIKQVERLIAQGADLNARSHNGMTALLIAAATDQYDMAIMLINAGADVFATTKLGHNAGRYATVNPYPEGTPQRQEQLRYLALLEKHGFPMPPPTSTQVVEMRDNGLWPPKKLPLSQP
jgi:hypothetical protein